MRFQVKSFNGVLLNDGTNYKTRIPIDALTMAGASVVEVERADTDPYYAGKKRLSRVLPIVIEMMSAPYSKIDSLITLFDPQDKNLYDLVLIDLDTSAEWTIKATTSGTPLGWKYNIVKTALYVQGSTWKKTTQSTTTWDITASGQTKVVTPAGTLESLPRFEITPQAVKSGGYLYKRWIPIYNNRTVEFKRYGIDLTNGGLNTSSLVGAGKMQADGDDWRAIVNGSEKNRWLADMNTTASKMWCVIDLAPKLEATLSGTIASSGAVSTINVKVTGANKAALEKLAKAPNKVVLIDNEAFTFTDVNVKSNPYQITGTARAQKGTSMAAHSDGAVIRWIEHDIWMVYGNSSLGAPETDDSEKPMFNLSTSTNTSWDYDDFWDTTPRAGAWTPNLIKNVGGECGFYTGNQNSEATPAAELGLAVRAYFLSNAWRSGSGQIEWRLFHPAGVTTVTASGEKRMEFTSWATFVGLQKSTNGNTWTNVWNEAKPTASAAWQALASHSSVSLSGTFHSLRFYMNGSVAAKDSNAIFVEYSDVTLTLASANVPTVALNGEQNNYYMDFTLTNQTNGEFMRVTGPAAVGEMLVIDCDAKTIAFANGTPAQSMKVGDIWLTLEPGSNTLRYDETGVADVDITIKWYDRRRL